MTPPRTALYARVSTVDQNCELQLKELRDYVARQKWPTAAEYIDNISGAKARRPALDRLLAAAARREFDAVLVWKIDRFGRSVLHFTQHLAELEKLQVRFLAISQGIDTDARSASGRLLVGILATIAEFERELIRERTAAGRQMKLSRGQPDSWMLPYGLAAVEGTPRIVEREAELVRQVFAWRERGKTIYQMCGLADATGIKPRRSAHWSPRSIRDMLTDRIYLGEYHRCGQIFAVPAIVGADPFHRVQAAMKDVYRRTVGRPSAQYLLRGIAWCSCGSRMHGKPLHYVCNRRMRRTAARGPQCAAQPGFLPRAALEELVWREVWRLVSDPVRFRQLALASAAQERAQKSKTSRDPARELARLRRREEKIREMAEADLYTTAEARDKIAALRNQMAPLETELRALRQVVEIAPSDAVERACRAIAAVGPEPEGTPARRLVLDALLELRATVEGRAVRITGKLPVPAAESGKKNGAHHLTGPHHCFEPIPFQINARIAA